MKADGAPDEEIARALTNLGMAYKASGRYNDSRVTLERALAIQEKLVDSNDLSLARPISSLAAAHESLGNLLLAEQLYRRALTIQQRILDPDDPRLVTTENNLGLLYHAMGRDDRAEPLLLHALEATEKMYGEHHLDMATSLSNLATVKQSQRDYARALQMYDQALGIRQNILGPDHPDVARSLNNLSTLHQLTGAYGLADSMQRRSLAILKSSPGVEPREVASSLNNLGTLSQSMADRKEAERCFRKALDIVEQALGSKHFALMAPLNNLAELYASNSDYARAEPLFIRAFEIAQRSLPPQHMTLKVILSNLADLHLRAGRTDLACEAFSRMQSSDGMGACELARKDYRAAEDHFRRTLDEFTQIPQSANLLLGVIIGLGRALEGEQRYDEATAVYERAILEIEDQRSAVAPAGRRRFLSGLIGAGQQRIAAYEGLVRVRAKLGDAQGAFYWSEHAKGRLLLEATARNWRPPNLPANLATEEERLTRELASLSQARDAVRVTDIVFARQLDEQDIPRARRALDRFVDRLRREAPAYAAVTYPKPLRVSELGLKGTQAVLEYEVTENETYAWLLSGSTIVSTFRIPVSRREVSERVRKYRAYFEHLGSKDDLRSYSPEDGRALYDLLVKEAIRSLPPGGTLIIVPDEVLALLPFHALVVAIPEALELATGPYGTHPRGVTYLGDLFDVGYAQSATALATARLMQRSNQPPVSDAFKSSMLIVADPVFDRANDERARSTGGGSVADEQSEARAMTRLHESAPSAFRRLPRTGALAERLRAKWAPVRVRTLVGAEATESRVRTASSEPYQYRLYATHGLLDGDVPHLREPALMLSQLDVNIVEAQQDGLLSLSEVFGLQMRSELVMLTACSTGVGEDVTGEGVLSMGQAFLYAGARNVVVTLWGVNEEPSMRFTEKVLESVREGSTPHDALHRTRRWLRAEGYEHPYYWAPFVLLGDQ